MSAARPAGVIRSSTSAIIRRRVSRSSFSSCRDAAVRNSAISRRSTRPGTRSTSPDATSRSHSRLAEDSSIFSSLARPRRLIPSVRSTTSSALSCGEDSRGVACSRAASQAASSACAASSTAAARISSAGRSGPWSSAMVQQRLPVGSTVWRG
jgi:hypothetical protein